MVQMSMNCLPAEVKAAYRGLALAPKGLPIDTEVLRVLLGAADDATASEWRATLVAHSLLLLAQDGTCTAHDLQLDFLRLAAPPAGAVERLTEWLAAPATLDLIECGNSP